MSQDASAGGEVLVIVDAQNDFCPGGALAVPGGDEIMPLIDALAGRYDHVVLTQDWHPPDQISFASNHGVEPYSVVQTSYGAQVAWPDHCVQGTAGADFHPIIASRAARRAELILRKGFNPAIDSYSAFFENDRRTPTGLAGYLRERELTRCVFVGLALDFCVRFSAEDAVRLGLHATVILSAARAIDTQGSLSEALASLKASGVRLLD